MATYPGMNLRGEVRESVSLDEDDLSDVEDEVFIRDGKNGYKFEDISVKKPLMAPRRKIGRSDLGTRIRNRPPCKAMCKLCCYAFVALTVLIGLIVLVVILVSLFPLPLDKLKEWIISRTNEKEPLKKVVPCSDIKVTDVWTVNFPKFISESSVQILDVNQDGIDDVIFGFGTGDDNTLPPELFCGIFMGVSPPCQGGVMALNGSNGNVLWRHWLSHSVFNLACTVDINSDNVTDCLITGKGGIFSVINARNGTLIWQFDDNVKDPTLLMDIYWANFIPDQDNDTIPDILASHTSQKLNNKSRPGHLLVVSGKTGTELQRISTPNDVETYYTPQLLQQPDGNYSVLFGTGSPTVPGNLSIVPLKEILAGNMTTRTLYQDSYKGVLSPAVLVDITGDTYPDIVTAMFNTTVVAIDGKSLKQIWNYSIPNAETLSVPTPGYFDKDNVTDFLVKYQTGRDFPTYYYSQTFIINGKTGKSIYSKPIVDSVGSQMAGLTLDMEGHGYDLFLYWIADCKNFEGSQEVFEFIPGSKIQQQSRADLCKLRFNSSMVAKLYALNQFDQPPGIEIYNSENRVLLEYNNTKMPLEEVKAYLNAHPEVQFRTPETNPPLMVEDAVAAQDYDQNQDPFRNIKYKDGSSFRHKDNGQGLIRQFTKDDFKRWKNPEQNQQKYENDYEPPETWQSKLSPFPSDELEADYNSYPDDSDSANIYNPNKLLLNANAQNSNNRDPRSKSEATTSNQLPQNSTTNSTESVPKTSKKKNLSDDARYGIYDYKNIQKAHTRLLHDLSNLPSEILRDTYFKNREHQLRKSKFEQRDLKSHEDRIRENEEVRKVIDQEKKSSFNISESLWDLESEKETQDRESGYWRGKRQVNANIIGIPRLTSVGALAPSLNTTKNTIDLILVTYWTPPKKGAQVLLQKDFQCISEKLKKTLDAKDQVHTFTKATLEEVFMKECLQERGIHLNPTHSNVNFNTEGFRNFPYFNQVSQLSLGQMTVYRLQLECICGALKKDEKCVKFLKPKEQRWASYLGKLGDGAFKTKN